MKKIYMIIAMLTLGIAGVWAQEIEVPEDAPRETWQLVYDDYRSLHEWDNPEYKDLTIDVTVVRGENCLYVQGLTKSSPDSWIKIGGTDDFLHNELLLWSNQQVSESGTTKYLCTGSIDITPDSGHTYYLWRVYGFCVEEPLILTRNFASDQLEYRAKDGTGYWPEVVPNLCFEASIFFKLDGTGNPEDQVWPNKECYLNPRLIDKTAGIGNVSAADDETNASVYTLTGAMVDPDNLAPGVYVSRGKKFVVK